MRECRRERRHVFRRGAAASTDHVRSRVHHRVRTGCHLFGRAGIKSLGIGSPGVWASEQRQIGAVAIAAEDFANIGDVDLLAAIDAEGRDSVA